ncbi:MAG: glycosyltransferase family 2 protein [Rivularia sp. T60_A2020_040]|nr:glycosyltransferase family 2 protein [Rivularia sp. T60_A2020_040]
MTLTNQSSSLTECSVLKHTPLVSIIIGNYNYERFVAQAIDSALNQTYKNIEVIVVDDGSQDKSREVIGKYGNRIIPIFKKNGGQPSNYNAGFAASKGEIVCFLDSDDWFVEDKIEKVVKFFQSSKEIGWCFHSVKLVYKDNNTLPKVSETQDYVTKECDYRGLLKSGKIPPCIPPSSALCFKRSILSKILPMPTPKIITNQDFYVKFMAIALSKGFILGDALTVQKLHGDNAASGIKGRTHLKARKFIYTGIWIKQEFSSFRKFANKLVGLGTGLNLISGKNDFENRQAIKNYFSSSSLGERIQINCIGIYYYLKEQLRG